MKHFSMKRNIFSKCLYGMMALGLLASCSNEPLLEDNKVLENETTTYVRISLVGEGVGSRADEVKEPGYEYGSADESNVGTLTLAFFGAGRDLVKVEHVDMTNATVDNGTTNTIDKIVTVVAPVNLPKNASHPHWVVAYVNPTSAASDLEVQKLENVMTRTRTREQVSHTPGFRTMNNSVYYDESTGNVRYATPVNFDTQFHLTEADAKAPGAEAIEITVERVEAKVKVNDISEIKVNDVSANINADTKVADYSLEFVPQAWFVNATEKRTFLIKNYRSESKNYTLDDVTLPTNLTTYFMSFNTLNSTFGTAIPFNNFSNKRSFWAIDPTYFIESDNTKDFYPDVSYDVKYGTAVNTNGKVYPLEYRSFADVMKENGSTNYVKFDKNGVKTHEYVLENTMSVNTLKSSDAMASMTAVELIGYYVVKDKSGNIVFDGSRSADENNSFYIRHEGSSDEPAYKFMLGDNKAINYFLEHAGNMLYVQKRNTAGEVINGEYEILRSGHLSENNPAVNYGVSYNDFELVYPESDITGGKKLSEQWRTLKIKNYNENIYVYDASINNGAGGYKKISELYTADKTNLSLRFYNIFGVVERFFEGKAHFTVPLKHLWNPNNTSNAFNANNVELGWYGVVRNHIYDLTIGNINGLGSGIGDPEQPIVPPTDNQQYYISTKLNILKWRQVSQSVDL